MKRDPAWDIVEWADDVDAWIEGADRRFTAIELHPEHPTDVNAAVLARLAVLEAELEALRTEKTDG